jgi:flagellar biosynthesis anti-sigma factor FlgM
MSISQLNGQERLRATMATAALRSNAAAAAGLTAPAATRQPDAVSISDAGRALAAGRVGAIKAAIADGTYSVDSKTLARSMIRNLGR